MEWFCAMGLLITLDWLYLELLRLLSKLNGAKSSSWRGRQFFGFRNTV